MSTTATSKANISLGRMLLRSLAHRRARSFSALAALTVSAAVSTALLTLYNDLDAKLHHEFRSFGANVVVNSTSVAISPDEILQVQNIAGTNSLTAPIAYAIAETDRKTPVVVAGVDFATMQKLDNWWKVGTWPGQPDQVLLGQRAAGFIANEKEVTLTYAGKALTLHGTGRLSTGGDEDSRIYLPLATFENWIGVQPHVLEIQVPGGAGRVNAVLSQLQHDLPQLHAEPVRQLVAGESSIVDKTHALMYGAVLLIALTVAVSVLATLSASVLERRRDFALMKALGASQSQLFAHFLLEALVLATVGVVAGYLLGSGLAWAIGIANFGTATWPKLSILPLVLLLNLGIAACAALFPARVLRGLQPAALLKGE
ncbi:ABC transporter permease [Granulicella mallensis]|jgi:putative ABC transport system permease protein|uniref:Putative ABC transport system permease protein n=1 Tax=Granulicella mallensis TaxID=940614 RepID=A0A7W7ZLI7_9BACT|nr:FtsX-like permease family protein [Granulicella mallensis]MBB5061963.1 putative ABC transport system permease protein [Granulicella mallensis]